MKGITLALNITYAVLVKKILDFFDKCCSWVKFNFLSVLLFFCDVLLSSIILSEFSILYILISLIGQLWIPKVWEGNTECQMGCCK